ncbi:F0F1 ATP synthase subunit A [Telmatobacter bradus]|uniref:F0F1 ATP synthase subunit A n=1 Tax=Telmatobacter bradus TaxID=474953 RepID=UPI003B427A8C
MTESLALTRLLNSLFGGVVASLLHTVGIQVDAKSAISDAFALELLVAVCLIAYFALVRATLSVEKPGAVQQVAEMLHEFIGGQAEPILGHDASHFQAFCTCIFLFVLLNNLLGLIPGVPAPTTSPVVPLGLAVPTFLLYNFMGFKRNGFGYIKQFCGPMPALTPLMFPIEVVSHLARVMSLTIRLYANMFAGDLVTLVFFSLIPVAIPCVFLGLHLFVSIVQAFVFTLLAMIYLSLAVAHEH